MSDKIVVEEDPNRRVREGLQEAFARIVSDYRCELPRVDILSETTVDSGGDCTPCEIIVKPNSK